MRWPKTSHVIGLALLCCAPPRVVSALSSSATSSIPLFGDFISRKQAAILAELEAVDGQAKFTRDDRPDGSGGMAVLEGGDVWEKAGVGVTIVRGALTEARAQAMSERGRAVEAGSTYAAAALSLVLHAKSPLVPTFRADVRLFEIERSDGSKACWVGGGADLTPSYLCEADATEFHRHWQGVCAKHDCADYPRFKQWCDEYFYIPSRGEVRGVGGIFFDDLDAPGAVDFARDVADEFLRSYLPLVARHRHTPHTEEQKQWQLVRRGRYLEFNLLFDRGVRFGLEAGPARVENLMVSAPPLVAWKYKAEPEPESPEGETIRVLREPQDWV